MALDLVLECHAIVGTLLPYFPGRQAAPTLSPRSQEAESGITEFKASLLYIVSHRPESYNETLSLSIRIQKLMSDPDK